MTGFGDRRIMIKDSSMGQQENITNSKKLEQKAGTKPEVQNQLLCHLKS